MNYEAVIGLEVHIELSTKSKIFCGCSTEFGGKPNTHCCPICTGMPGTLPSLNKSVVEYAIRAGLVLNCKINKNNRFDRKNYFYPDLPKAYQISQLYYPICRNGYIDIETENGTKAIGITEIHMEEDAGKLIHDDSTGCTFIDYNRCGVPLLEIVSEPDFRSADEVIAYLKKLCSVFQYLGISDCKMQEGSMRADVNLSVRPVGSDALGTRTEMKNLNSFKAISRAIAYEYSRQVEILNRGDKIIQQTRRWDDAQNKSYAMRSKESANDYRYFPEPDLPAVIIENEWIDSIKATMPELAHERIKRYVTELGLSKYEAEMITSSQYIADYFEQTISILNSPKEVAAWIMSDIFRLLNEKCLTPEQIALTPKNFVELIKMTNEGIITRNTAKDILSQIIQSDYDCIAYVNEHNLSRISDDKLIQDTVNAVISGNAQAVEDFKKGKSKAIAYLIGQCMKQLKGKADPNTIKDALIERLN